MAKAGADPADAVAAKSAFAPGSPPPSLRLSLQFADGGDRAVLPRQRVARWLRAALARPAEITVRIVGAAEGLALNRAHRGQDHATNVLTFDYQREPTVVADIVVCAPVVAAEAAAAGIDRAAHYAHLLVHGALHAQGFDHLRPSQAERMEHRESAILVGLGFADPYAAHRAGARAAPARPDRRRSRLSERPAVPGRRRRGR